jgi:thiol-disulfide isomerase/thioredoxin
VNRQRKILFYRFAIGAFVVAGLILPAGCSGSDAPAKGPEPVAPEVIGTAGTGQPAPAASSTENHEIPAVKTVTAAEIAELLAAGKGKVTVVNLWATWCPPCRAELPDIKRFYTAANRENVHFVALSVDAPESLDTIVRPFVREEKIPFPVYVLAERDVDALARVLKAELSGSIPATFIYNTGGELKVNHTGEVDHDWLDKQIQKIS